MALRTPARAKGNSQGYAGNLDDCGCPFHRQGRLTSTEMKLLLSLVWLLFVTDHRGRPHHRGWEGRKCAPTSRPQEAPSLLTLLRSSASPCPSAASGYSGQSPTELTGGKEEHFHKEQILRPQLETKQWVLLFLRKKKRLWCWAMAPRRNKLDGSEEPKGLWGPPRKGVLLLGEGGLGW